MIRNEFIHELDIDLDMDYITRLVTEKQNKSADGLRKHQRKVSDDPYMSSILTKYPLLNNIYNINLVEPFTAVPLHIDSFRSCALNIPITGTGGSHTIFYRADDAVLEHAESNQFDLIKSPATEIFRFTMTRPVLLNTKIPHKVINVKNYSRLTVSWSFQKTTFQEAVDYFNSFQT